VVTVMIFVPAAGKLVEPVGEEGDGRRELVMDGCMESSGGSAAIQNARVRAASSRRGAMEEAPSRRRGARGAEWRRNLPAARGGKGQGSCDPRE
jgi:hypothetical protein